MKRFLLILFTLMVVMVGCNKAEVYVSTEAQGIANRIAKENNNGDIFMFNDRVYERDSLERDFEKTIEEKVGEIQKVYSTGDSFQDGMATKLPIGTELYATSISLGNGFLLVNIGGKWIIYKSLPQG